MPEHELVSGFMHALLERETTSLARLLQCPSREHPRYFGHIFLGVTASYSQGVQFHQFAAVVFVQAAALSLGLVDGTVAPGSLLPVVVVALGDAVGNIRVRPHAQP